MKKVLLLLAFFSLILNSCKENENEEGETIIKGIVTDYYSGQVVSDYGIKIEGCTGGLFSSTTTLLDTFITNNRGEFYYSFYGKKDNWYNISSIDNSEYSRIYQSVNPPELYHINVADVNVFNFKTKKYKICKLQLSKVSNLYSHILVYSPYNLLYAGKFIDTVLIVNKAIPEEKMYFRFCFYNEPYYYNEKEIQKYYVISLEDTTIVKFEY